jgi:hypothetical protein
MDHWLYDAERHKVAGWLVLILLVAAGTGASVLFVRRTRDG